MKHLKKFNEELNIDTYRRAAHQLKDIGHSKRATNMQSWIDVKQREKEEKEELRQVKFWKESVETFSKFGKFKFRMSTIGRGQFPIQDVDDFYTSLVFEKEAFEDNLADNLYSAKNSNKFVFPVSLYLTAIPKDLDSYVKYYNTPSIKSSMNRGSIMGIWITFYIKIEGDSISIDEINLYGDDGEEIILSIADRATAGKIRSLLLGIFKGTIDYPVKYPTEDSQDNLHDCIETVVCNKSGLTSDYGLNMDHFVEAINKVSANSLFNEK